MSIRLHEAVLSRHARPRPLLRVGDAGAGRHQGDPRHHSRLRRPWRAVSPRDGRAGRARHRLRRHRPSRARARARLSAGSASASTSSSTTPARLRTLIDERAKKTKAPTFLFGPCFGGLTAASSVLEVRGVQGVVLSAPLLRARARVPKIKLLAGRLASRLYPKLGLPSGLHGKDMTHDAERAKA